MRLRTIRRTVMIYGATPGEVFEVFMDAQKHGALIGAKVKMGRKAGDAFSAFDGFVTGRNLNIVPGRMIVQTWRGGVWESVNADSILSIFFDQVPGGTRVHMAHAGLPPQFEERWDHLYWKPLQKMFAK